MNSHIYNLQERTECNKVKPKLRLWVINYEITDIAKGAAVVKANNAKEASDILLADSQFNAYRKIFNIIRIEEIHTEGMYANLAIEEWIRFSDIPNLDASKIIYIPSNGMTSRNVQGAIDELNSNIKNIDITSDIDLSEYAKKSEMPTKTSELENDSSYITTERVEEMIEKGNGVTIVSSVDELPSDAPHGSLATVSNIKTEEIEVEDKFSVRDIYVEENPDCEPLMELKLKVPGTLPTEPFWFILGAKGYNNTNELIQGRYLGLMLMEGEFVTMVAENGSPILNMSPLVTDYSIDEEILTQVNEIISSWGGIVLYGSAGEGQELLTPTEAQIEALDSFISYNNGTHIETVETHTNDIYFKETTGWRKINDVKIIDSVDKLDKNAPQGSLASVAVNTIGEAKFSELHQPTSDEVNTETGALNTTNLSSVSSISINSSFDTSVEGVYFEVDLISKDFNPQGGVGSVIYLYPMGGITANLATQEVNELELFTANEDGTIITNKENLDTINNLLSSTEFVYCGVVSTDNYEFIDPSYADVFYKAIGNIQKTDLYIKDVGGWKIVGDEELKAKVDNLEAKVDNLGLIVNSVDELPQDAQTGSLASVLEEYHVRTKASSFKNVANKEHILEVNIVEGTINTPGTYRLELVSKDGTESIFLNTGYGTGSCWFSYTEGGNTTSLGEYSYTPPTLRVITDRLKILNEKLKTNEFVYVRPTDDSAEKSWFVPTAILKEYKKTILYTKNETGWEQYAENIYNSVEDLPQDAPLGSLAKVMNEGTRFISFADIAAKTKLESIDIHVPEKIDKKYLNTSLSIHFVGKNATSPAYQPFLALSPTSSGLELRGSTGGTSSTSYAKYDAEGIRTSMTSIDLTEQFNKIINEQGYAYLWEPATDKELSDLFFKAGVGGFISTILYVKNTTGWEQIAGEVANDLEGGANKVLSAEMGKTLSERIEEVAENKVTSANVTNIVSITQADYDALESKSEATLYLITE